MTKPQTKPQSSRISKKCDTYLRRYFIDIGNHLGISISAILRGSLITPQRFYEISQHTYVKKIPARDLIELNNVIRKFGLQSTPEILYKFCDIYISQEHYLKLISEIMDMKGKQWLPLYIISDN